MTNSRPPSFRVAAFSCRMKSIFALFQMIYTYDILVNPANYMGTESFNQKKEAPTAEEYLQIEKDISTQQQSLATAEIGDMDSTLEKIDSLEEERVEAYESGRAEAEIENERIDTEKAAQEAQRQAKIDEEIVTTREQFKAGNLSREKLGELVAQLKALESEKGSAPKSTNQEATSVPQQEAHVEVAPQTEETSIEPVAINNMDEERVENTANTLETETATPEKDPVFEQKKIELFRRYGAIDTGKIRFLETCIDEAKYNDATHKPQYKNWVESVNKMKSDLKKVEQEYMDLTGRHPLKLLSDYVDWHRGEGS
jgi:hypothetical protein